MATTAIPLEACKDVHIVSLCAVDPDAAHSQFTQRADWRHTGHKHLWTTRVSQWR